MNRFYRFLLLFIFAGFHLTTSVVAQTRLASIFTDNMVLQQNTDVKVWGWDKAGRKISIVTPWNKKTYQVITDDQGKWTIKISTPAAAKKAYDIAISNGKTLLLKNILIGEVWLCTGQSNMEMPLKGFKGQPILGSNDLILKSGNPHIRIYTVPRSSVTTPQDNSKPSLWKSASPEAVANFSATGYVFGKLLNELLDIPVGLINVSYGGSSAQAWMSAMTLRQFPQIKVPAATDTIKLVSRTPTTLYNGMIHPVAGFTVRGAIWYQGESNYDDPDLYEKLFPSMVAQWRTEWNQGDFPFYYAQIAPYNYRQLPPYLKSEKANSAFLRDAQRKSLLHIAKSGMVVLLDVGEENNIHPANKEAGGKRLALLALAKTYGLKGFGAESPMYQSHSIEKNTSIVKFSNANNGLTSFGKGLTLFEIAGADKRFYPAKAIIKGETVVVSAAEVTAPVAIRYAFRDFVTAELFNTEGLPASSFRTDDW